MRTYKVVKIQITGGYYLEPCESAPRMFDLKQEYTNKAGKDIPKTISYGVTLGNALKTLARILTEQELKDKVVSLAAYVARYEKCCKALEGLV